MDDLASANVIGGTSFSDDDKLYSTTQLLRKKKQSLILYEKNKFSNTK